MAGEIERHATELVEAYQVNGLAVALAAFYKEALLSRPPAWDFAAAESALNRIGYHLLRNGSVDEAINVFKLNTTENPSSGNTWDSLGEAYLKQGQVALALESYRRSLQVDPNNRNAAQVLERTEHRAKLESSRMTP